jgi:hypothetical protein
MTLVAWILIFGFGIVIVQVAYGVREGLKHLARIGTELNRIQFELRTTSAGTFASELHRQLEGFRGNGPS